MSLVRIFAGLWFLPLAHALTCVGALALNDQWVLTIHYHDGKKSEPISARLGSGIRPERNIQTLTLPGGERRVLKQLKEEVYSSVAEAEHALKNEFIQAQLNTYRRAELVGGPIFYGLELIEVDENKFSFFAIMDDRSGGARQFYTLKGLQEIVSDPIRKDDVSELLTTHPNILEKAAEDLVEDIRRGVSRSDPDFVIKPEGRAWLDPDGWLFDLSTADAEEQFQSNVTQVLNLLESGLGDVKIIRQFGKALKTKMSALPTEQRNRVAISVRDYAGVLHEPAHRQAFLSAFLPEGLPK